MTKTREYAEGFDTGFASELPHSPIFGRDEYLLGYAHGSMLRDTLRTPICYRCDNTKICQSCS